MFDKERRDLAAVGGHRREPILPRAHRRERFDLKQRSLAAALQLEVDLLCETEVGMLILPAIQAIMASALAHPVL